MLKEFFKTFQAWLLPYICIVCGRSAESKHDLCDECKRKLPWLETSCLQCGKPLPTTQPQCGQCLQHPRSFDQTLALFHYLDPIKQWLIDLKFHQKLLYSKLLSDLLIDRLQKKGMPAFPDVIIPMPLHKKRLRERGFNQALELAKPLAKNFKFPIDYQSCKRLKLTLPQTILPIAERKKNVKDAFIIAKDFKAKSVWIIDDVMTSTETCQSLSEALKQTGVEKILICCIARAGKTV